MLLPSLASTSDSHKTAAAKKGGSSYQGYIKIIIISIIINQFAIINISRYMVLVASDQVSIEQRNPDGKGKGVPYSCLIT